MTTLALVSPQSPDATPIFVSPEDAFAVNLVAECPDVAARITAALLNALDAGVAAILKASAPS